MTSFRLPFAAASVVALLSCGGQTSGPGGGGSGSSSGSGGSSSGNGGSSSGHNGSSSGSSSSGGAGSSGGTGSSSGISPGCSSFSTATYPVDATSCNAQLMAATSCDQSVCSYQVEIPCYGDAGIPASDAGQGECTALCTTAAPPGATEINFCQFSAFDGGLGGIAQCGGCGI